MALFEMSSGTAAFGMVEGLAAVSNVMIILENY
jgi:hypothetical protein